jgi:hypothetical protein
MVVVPGVLWPSGSAHAACADQTPEISNDLSLECLIGPRPAKTSSDPTLREQSLYRSLISELSAVMALPVMDPADTTGYSGFHFSFDVVGTTIRDPGNNAVGNYWSGYAQPDGTHSQAGVRHVSGSILPVATLMLRKGIWLPLPPLPSVEIGLGASNLLQSNIYALNGYLKFAIHEGYHDVPVPSFAVRASVSRIAGAPQVDLTIITVEGTISKAFGVGGTFTLEPYIGGGALFSIARSQVIDTAPTIDLYRGPANSTGFSTTDALAQKIVFPTQDNIIRWRLFGGINLHVSIFSITGYFSYFGVGADNGFDLTTLPQASALGPTPAGSAAACRTVTATGATICPKDLAGDQYQFGGSIGLRF